MEGETEAWRDGARVMVPNTGALNGLPGTPYQVGGGAAGITPGFGASQVWQQPLGNNPMRGAPRDPTITSHCMQLGISQSPCNKQCLGQEQANKHLQQAAMEAEHAPWAISFLPPQASCPVPTRQDAEASCPFCGSPHLTWPFSLASCCMHMDECLHCSVQPRTTPKRGFSWDHGANCPQLGLGTAQD